MVWDKGWKWIWKFYGIRHPHLPLTVWAASDYAAQFRTHPLFSVYIICQIYGAD